MAAAEQLLNEAQYAFHNISFGDSPQNRRNRRRASSLCRRIIRSYPVSMEAGEAHAILRRLGEEAYTPQFGAAGASPAEVPSGMSLPAARPSRWQAVPRADHHSPPVRGGDANVSLDWRGLVSLLLSMPRAAWIAVAFVALTFFSLFSYLVIVPLVIVALMVGPLRFLLSPPQRRQMNRFIIAANTWIDARIRNNAGS